LNEQENKTMKFAGVRAILGAPKVQDNSRTVVVPRDNSIQKLGVMDVRSAQVLQMMSACQVSLAQRHF
jgi:hypothetical protein